MKKLPYLLISVFIFAADQLSKWWISEHVLKAHATGEQSAPGLMEWYLNTPPRMSFTEMEIWPFFNLVMVWNHGISFGLFNTQTDYGPFILIIISFAVIAVFLVWLFRSEDNILNTAIALVIGGAIGNVIDRFRFEAVMDFLDFHLYGYHWPAFNIADSAIVIGVFVLIIQAFLCTETQKAGKTLDET